MNTLEFSLLIAACSLGAGLLGALTGLGGGVVIVPLLALLFDVDIRYAIGASLVSVIATSSGAAAAYVREGFSNIRIGMFLEIATTLGALLGAYLAAASPTTGIAIIFGVVLLYSAYSSFRSRPQHRARTTSPTRWPQRLRSTAPIPAPERSRAYTVQRVPARLRPDVRRRHALRPARHRLRRGQGARHGPGHALPFKVSTTTSNFMIGVTAAASAGIYLSRAATSTPASPCPSCSACSPARSSAPTSWCTPKSEPSDRLRRRHRRRSASR